MGRKKGEIADNAVVVAAVGRLTNTDEVSIDGISDVTDISVPWVRCNATPALTSQSWVLKQTIAILLT